MHPRSPDCGPFPLCLSWHREWGGKPPIMKKAKSGKAKAYEVPALAVESSLLRELPKQEMKDARRVN